MMVSCGSHSRLPATSKRSAWRASAPEVRYHLPAPGVVSSAAACLDVSTLKDSSSPPAIPPGGCTTMAWQTASPSGYSGFCTTSGPSCLFAEITVLSPRAENASDSSAFQDATTDAASGAATGSAMRMRRSYRQQAADPVALHVAA